MINMFSVLGSGKQTTKCERLYETYKYTMYSVGLDVTKNIDDAEDVVNETMTKVLGILDKIAEESIGTKRCRNLMITIAKNAAIDCLRKRKRQAILVEFEKRAEPTKSAEDLYIDMENCKVLLACITNLDQKYRDVIRLKLIHNLTAREVAGILNITEAAAYTRYARAKRFIGEMMVENAD